MGFSDETTSIETTKAFCRDHFRLARSSIVTNSGKNIGNEPWSDDLIGLSQVLFKESVVVHPVGVCQCVVSVKKKRDNVKR